MIESTIANYADDNIYISSNDIESVIRILETDSTTLQMIYRIGNKNISNRLYYSSNDIESVIRILETDSSIFKWLSLDILTPNPVESHMLLRCPNVNLFATIDRYSY